MFPGVKSVTVMGVMRFSLADFYGQLFCNPKFGREVESPPTGGGQFYTPEMAEVPRNSRQIEGILPICANRGGEIYPPQLAGI